MTDVPKITEVDCSTGVETVRDMTEDEIAQYSALQEQAEADRLAQEEATAAREALKASAKAKLIAGQPLTVEEADTLVL
jgi:hypothetical protein